jgi:glycosyltransferase involved in cell wall biosynthesis
MRDYVDEVDLSPFRLLVNSTSGDNPVISVIIPSFNEERGLEIVLGRTHNVLDKLGVRNEVIVINDGSTDRTSEVALKNKAILLENPRNMGKGASLRRGLECARGEFIILMDADGENKPEDIPVLLEPFLNDGKVSMVIGSRFRVEVEREFSRVHMFGNKIFNLVIFLLTGRYVTDSQSGFRAYRCAALKDVSIDSFGFDVETEMLIKMLRKGLEFKEVPVTFDPRIEGSSRLRTFKDGFNILKAILKYTLINNH